MVARKLDYLSYQCIYGSKKSKECGICMEFGTLIDVTILNQMRGSIKFNYEFLGNHCYMISLLEQPPVKL